LYSIITVTQVENVTKPLSINEYRIFGVGLSDQVGLFQFLGQKNIRKTWDSHTEKKSQILKESISFVTFFYF